MNKKQTIVLQDEQEERNILSNSPRVCAQCGIGLDDNNHHELCYPCQYDFDLDEDIHEGLKHHW